MTDDLCCQGSDMINAFGFSSFRLIYEDVSLLFVAFAERVPFVTLRVLLSRIQVQLQGLNHD